MPASDPPEDVTHDSDEEEHHIDGSAMPPPVETLETDATEVTVVAAITTPEKALPKVTSFGPPGKHRSTMAIVVLSIVTLGVYSLVWHHRINREVGNFDTRMHVIPGRSTLAVTIPWALGWLVSIAGAVRIVLAVANVSLPFNPHFSVLQAYVLLGGFLLIPYLELVLSFSAVAIGDDPRARAHRRGSDAAHHRCAVASDSRNLVDAAAGCRRPDSHGNHPATSQPRLGGRHGGGTCGAPNSAGGSKLTAQPPPRPLSCAGCDGLH